MTATRDLSAEVTDLSSQVEKLRTAQMRAEAAVSAAEEEHRRAMDRLTAEFGVSSVEEARSLLDELGTDVEKELDEIRRQLAVASGGSHE